MSGLSNNSLSQSLQKLLPETFDIQEAPLGYESGNILGWNSTLYLKNGFPFSGGTATSRARARRIAIAEAFERALVDKLFLSEKHREELLLNIIPSCSGFAAGFNQRKTHFRALSESVERWAWSKWIDDRFKIPERKFPVRLSPFEKLLTASFLKTQFYEQQVLAHSGSQIFKLKFLVFLGFTKDGVFPGSRVCLPEEENWEHPLIEASRNHINFGETKKLGFVFSKNDIIAKRSEFFAKNSNIALSQIHRATKDEWPIAPLQLWKKAEIDITGVFLSRAICGDHTPWHLGPIDRFVY